MKRMVLLLMSALVLSCADDAKRPNEDSLLAVEALGVIDGMRDAYLKKDFASSQGHFTAEAYKDTERQLKNFDSAELEFTPKRILVSADGEARMVVYWSGSWEVSQRTYQKSGTAEFLLSGSPLKVTSIEGASPFRQPADALLE